MEGEGGGGEKFGVLLLDPITIKGEEWRRRRRKKELGNGVTVSYFCQHL